ncbi:MAG TPA: von Willebrand factor type A domain-containing protein [Niabella sp.]|nr:von Willebrand factor type A domain-containing protein [Niabella sp.]
MNYLKFFAAALVLLTLAAFTIIKKTVKGTITDENNQAISSATIQEKGTQNAVSSNASGNFTIEVESDKAVLIITAVGYRQQEVKVGKSTKLNIVLKSLANNLDEVIVVGYGTKEKKAFTGAVASVHASPSYNYNQSVRIRGTSSLYGSRSPVADESWRNNNDFSREGYDNIKENPFLKSADNPLSTFSIDVDGASYSNIRRFISNGQLPPDGAVRIEEMINYFTYNYPQPAGDTPFSINTDYTVCPWNEKHHLVTIGLQGKKIPTENLPAANIVFLIDVSGSMWSQDKLPLVQSSMKLLADQLRPQDKVAIVVYAGSAGLVLPSTDGNDKTKIKEAIDALQAGGSTAGGAGIKLAYKVAQDNFIKNGNNRIVLCTDGDFNVGQSSDDELERMIEEKRKSGVYLTVLGFGTGNYQDAKMQKLANKGNGNHAYIDNLSEARKVLISQFGGTMFTIAKDVKLQVEFNPAKVQGYRLIGYENRMLAKEDFNDDKKDAGELGSGHTVTALYEIIPVGVNAPELRKVDDLKYQKPKGKAPVFNNSNEVMTVKFRYKKPAEDKSLLLEKIISGSPVTFNNAGNNIKLAAAVAKFGMLLRNSEYKGAGDYTMAADILSQLNNEDKGGYQSELLGLIRKAVLIKSGTAEMQTFNEKKPAIRRLSR